MICATKRSVVFLILLLLPCSPDLYSCAPAPPPGTFVLIQEESAIIVWDSAKKVQHFIRRASFRSDAADFGFLVPTPAKPDLAEVPNDSFQILGEVMQPKIVQEEEHGLRLTSLIGEFLLLRRGYETAAAPRAVRVLEFKSVAGYDAAVLEADDAGALNGWLKTHGYPASPALQKWFEPYVALRWKITAFKVAGDRTSAAPATATVRMSFPADRPFFPYREPEADQAHDVQARSLQVLLLSDTRMEGVLGDGSPWAGHLQWADRIPDSGRFRLLEKLGLQNAGLAGSLWLSAFEDPSTPRPGHNDLFFRPSADQTPQIPPPYVIHHDARIPIPLDVLAVLAAIIFLLLRRR